MGTTYYEGGIIVEHDGETPPAVSRSTRVVPSAAVPGKAVKAKAAPAKAAKAVRKGKKTS